ncbi:hypothetical protein FJZ31_19890 [Candidatus Poribacteria bacterium]|nr:hypothetical protein [Candidatus Poribacteria bacterium]
MNNKPMENIWLNIKKKPSRKVMRSFLTWRTVVWVILLGLIGFCIWQGMQWWRLNTDRSSTMHYIQPTIDHQLASLLEEINVKKNRIAFLEEQALSFQNEDLISWITEQAETAQTQMIGVEYLKERQVEQYIYTPVAFTLRGDYHSFGRLMNLLEGSQYPLKLDYLSIATQQSSPESLIMELVLVRTGFQSSEFGVRSSELKNKSSIPPSIFSPPPVPPAVGSHLPPSVSAPQKSSEQPFNHIGADFVYPSSDELRNIFQLYQEVVTPQAKNVQPPRPLILTGVIYNEHNPLVIFMDGQNKSYLARVNDTILDYTVLKIEPRSVILKHADTRIELKVFASLTDDFVLRFKDKESSAKF